MKHKLRILFLVFMLYFFPGVLTHADDFQDYRWQMRQAEQMRKFDDQIRKWEQRDIWLTGKSLWTGTALLHELDPSKFSPSTLERRFPVNRNSLRIDSHWIQLKELNKHAENTVINTYESLAVGSALGTFGTPRKMAGATLTVGQTAFKMYDIWKVGNGRAGPESIRAITPHFVMAWDALKGPEHRRFQNFYTSIHNTHNEPGFQIETKGFVEVKERFSTTAPGFTGHYGFDPMTDSMVKTTRSYLKTHTHFNGTEWQRHYQQNIGLPRSGSPSIPRPSTLDMGTIHRRAMERYWKPAPAPTWQPVQTPRWTPVAAPKWTPPPMPVFHPMPTFRR